MSDPDNPTDGAQAQMAMLEAIIEEGMGVSFRGDIRDDGKSNEDVIRFLAGEDENGNPNPDASDRIRDIRPSGDQEKEAAQRYLEVVDKRLDVIGKTAKGKDVDPEKQANGAAVAGLRSAGKYTAESMLENSRKMITTSGPGSGGSAKPVTPEYASQRSNRFGIPENVIYVRTGQLQDALINGKLKIEKTDQSVKALLEARKAAE
jgi:hypothetical protein